MSQCYNYTVYESTIIEFYTLSLHDALPISVGEVQRHGALGAGCQQVLEAHVGEGAAHHHLVVAAARAVGVDRKSTRLNSSHSSISYAVFCLKKKININTLYKS